MHRTTTTTADQRGQRDMLETLNADWISPCAENAARLPPDEGTFEAGGRRAPSAMRTAGDASAASLHLIQRLLFVMECPSPELRDQKRRLNLFMTRYGGFHLLLVLLDAHYRTATSTCRQGLVFSELCGRIAISERGLRMLLNDAVAMNLVEQLPLSGNEDRRRRSYGLTPCVVLAWEALLGALDGILPEPSGKTTRPCNGLSAVMV